MSAETPPPYVAHVDYNVGLPPGPQQAPSAEPSAWSRIGSAVRHAASTIGSVATEMSPYLLASTGSILDSLSRSGPGASFNYGSLTTGPGSAILGHRKTLQSVQVFTPVQYKPEESKRYTDTLAQYNSKYSALDSYKTALKHSYDERMAMKNVHLDEQAQRRKERADLLKAVNSKIWMGHDPGHSTASLASHISGTNTRDILGSLMTFRTTNNSSSGNRQRPVGANQLASRSAGQPNIATRPLDESPALYQMIMKSIVNRDSEDKKKESDNASSVNYQFVPSRIDTLVAFYRLKTIKNIPKNMFSQIPLMPSNVDLLSNIREAQFQGMNENYMWFYNSVKNGGKWDFKVNPEYGQIGSNYENFGNFHFGVVGLAFGLPEEILLRGAGWYQEFHGKYDPDFGHFWGGPPYGDDPKDQLWIKQGVKFYKELVNES